MGKRRQFFTLPRSDVRSTIVRRRRLELRDAAKSQAVWRRLLSFFVGLAVLVATPYAVTPADAHVDSDGTYQATTTVYVSEYFSSGDYFGATIGDPKLKYQSNGYLFWDEWMIGSPSNDAEMIR